MMLVTNRINVLSSEVLEREAREIFGEVEEKIAEDVVALQTYLCTQPHLQRVRRDELFLRQFYRGCNYDLDKTKEKLDYFFCVKTNLPAWFDNWDPSQTKIRRILESGAMLPLKGFDRHGRWAMMVRSTKIDPATMEVDDLYKVSLMLLTLSLEGNLQANTRGFVLIQDQSGIGTQHIMMMTPNLMKKHVAVFQDAYPMENLILASSSTLYYTNMPRIAERIFNVFMGFLNEKYKNMIKVLARGDEVTLIEDVGRDIIPSDYGGNNESTESLTRFWLEEIYRHREWLEEQTRYRTEEKLRPGKPKLDLFDDRCVVM